MIDEHIIACLFEILERKWLFDDRVFILLFLLVEL